MDMKTKHLSNDFYEIIQVGRHISRSLVQPLSQSKVPQPLLTGPALQPKHLCSPQLNLPQLANIFLLLGVPKIGHSSPDVV